VRRLFLGLVFVSAAAAAEDQSALSDIAIMGASVTSYEAFLGHVSFKNPGVDRYYSRRLYEAYQQECRSEGVDVVVALSQMIHETDYLLFSGSVSPSQYNYAGLGATAPGAPGLSFPNLDTGVRAHVQHLKAYGSLEPLNGPLVDPRFGFVARGSATTVLGLTGRWASDPDYGVKVMAHANRIMVW